MHPQHSRGNPSEPPGIHHGTITDLSSLQDPPPGQRPNYPYHKIARAAILGSPRKKMTLSELYEAVAERFEFFRTPEAGPWKASIRHHLTLSAQFVKVRKSPADPGRGEYWTVDLNIPEGQNPYKRERKRGKKPKKRSPARPPAPVIAEPVRAETPQLPHQELRFVAPPRPSPSPSPVFTDDEGPLSSIDSPVFESGSDRGSVDNDSDASGHHDVRGGGGNGMWLPGFPPMVDGRRVLPSGMNGHQPSHNYGHWPPNEPFSSPNIPGSQVWNQLDDGFADDSGASDTNVHR
ncbi:winged helix DNA-binding domain-containing protein [Sistotremastrum suecicum HHB10207 ss-3]|nr:winged helix DNA-binding domain-containing protein [Sistotremastrum suecicum HHB10207 ss-3]